MRACALGEKVWVFWASADSPSRKIRSGINLAIRKCLWTRTMLELPDGHRSRRTLGMHSIRPRPQHSFLFCSACDLEVISVIPKHKIWDWLKSATERIDARAKVGD